MYGILLDDAKDNLLVIKKAVGPYAGRYDLPGGGVRQCEALLEALRREFLEETGMGIIDIETLGTFDFLVPFKYEDTNYTQHVATFFRIGRIADYSGNKEIVRELITPQGKEINDSDGALWVKTSSLNKNNSSPLILKAIQILNSEKLTCEIEEVNF